MTDIKQDTLTGIHAVYEDRQYDVRQFGRYFTSLDSAWTACRALASRRGSEQLIRFSPWPGGSSGWEPLTLDELVGERIHEIEDDSSSMDILNLLEALLASLRARRELGQQFTLELKGTSIPLKISRLRVQSPMEVTLAAVEAVAHGGGVTAAVIYGVHLLVHVMRDPEQVGAWVPRLVAGWHKGMAEMEHAREEHDEAEHERRQRKAIEDASADLIAAAETLKEVPATEVTAIGAGEPPDDLVAATTDLPN